MEQLVNSFSTTVTNFLTRARIDEAARTGNPSSKDIITTFGELDIKYRGWKGVVNLFTLQNSHLNRPLNVGNPKTLIDKIRYAIEIIAGVADIGKIPVSYVYSFEEFLTNLCLYMKDRGHIMHILSNLASIKPDKATWLQIMDELGDCRGASFLQSMKDQMLITINTMDNTSTISVKDMIGPVMMQRLMSLEVTVGVTVESLKNHVYEMDKINNNSNGWTAHNYGMLELRSADQIDDPRINVDTIYKTVCTSDVLQSREAFLRGREETCRKNAEHEDEVVYYFLGAWEVYDQWEDWRGRWTAYEKVADIALRKKLYGTIFENNHDTDSILEVVKFIDRVGSCADWRRLHAHLWRVAEMSKNKQTNLKALTPQQQRSAMKYLDIVKVLIKKAKIGSNIPHVVRTVVDTALELLHVPKDGKWSDNKLVYRLWEEETSAHVRHKHFFEPLYQKALAKLKETGKSQRGARAAKTDKLAILSGVLADVEMPEAFTILDRVREDHYQLTRVNVATGEGFELGHIKAGTEFTEGNTFLQFAKDNKFRSAFDVTPTHWEDYRHWLERVYTASDQQSPELEEAYQNTIQFCLAMTTYGELI